MTPENKLPVGYRWRSSRWFIISCITVAFFSANFLHTYIIPILPVMLEDRLQVDKSQTQATTSIVLSVHALVSMLAGPIIGHLADKIPNRKGSLIMSLSTEMIGTVIIMLSTSVPILLVGRAIQAIGGSAAWIVGYTTLAETVGQEETGKVIGVIMSFYASGSLFGPMASGTLLSLFGYWVTWIAAILLLIVDLLMRVVMIENKRSPRMDSKKDIEAPDTDNPDEVNEQTSLLHASAPKTNSGKPRSNVTTSPPPENFYIFILTNCRALTALTCHCTMPIILLSLDTTLPLHAARTFGWNTAQISSMFLLLVMPSLLFGSLLGMLKDRVGTRFLTGFGFLAVGFSIWMLGAASRNRPLTTSNGLEAQIISMIALAGIGLGRSFINGTGIMEITKIMKDAQEEQPHRFGPNGKMSSAYSLTNFTCNTGMLIGPILSNYLIQTVGYFYMNTVIATLSCAVGILVILFLDKR